MKSNLPAQQYSAVPQPRLGGPPHAPPPYRPGSVEGEIGPEEIGRVLRRQKWLILGVFLFAVTASAAYSYLRVPVWEATALIRIEEGRSGSAAAGLLPQMFGESELETEMRVVATRPVLAEVVEVLDLNFQVTGAGGTPRHFLFSQHAFSRGAPEATYRLTRLGEDAYELTRTLPQDSLFDIEFRAGQRVSVPGGSFTVADRAAMLEAGIDPPTEIEIRTLEFGEALDQVQRNLVVERPDPEASLFQLSYEHTDRYLARNLVNEIAVAFIARRRHVQKTEARSTVSFLKDQSAEVRTELESAENALQEFREREHVVALASEADEQVRRLAELQTQRTQLATERDALENLLLTIRESATGRPDYLRLIAFPTFLQNRTIQGMVEQLTAAEQQRTALKERWTENHPGVVALDQQIVQLEERLGDIGRNYARSLNDQIASLDAVLVRFGSDLESIPGRELQFARLERRTRMLSNLDSHLQQRLKEAEVLEAVEDTNVRIVEPATLARRPARPVPLWNIGFGAVAGLLAGLALGFLRERLNKTLHPDDDVEQMLGVSILTRVPHVPIVAKSTKTQRRPETLVAYRAGQSLPAEAYRMLRTNVTFARTALGETGREVIVTSPGAQDGKSVTACNLAVTFAQQGHRTLLVDADLRRSTLHHAFGLAEGPGLSEYLAGQLRFPDLCVRTEIAGLFVAPAGATPPNPAELLGNHRMDVMLRRARAFFDAIVIDTPPVLAVTDAPLLASKIGGVVLVVRSGRTHRQAAEDTLHQLRQVGARILGIVINDARKSSRYGYQSSYYDAYCGADDDKLPRAG